MSEFQNGQRTRNGMGKAGEGHGGGWAAGRPDVTVGETHLTGTHERIPTPKGA